MNPLFEALFARPQAPAPGLAQRMMGLGLYEPPPMPQAPVVGHEWSPQPTADSSVPDILAQIEAARRWFGGNKGEEHHTRMNFDNNVRGISSPYARGLWL